MTETVTRREDIVVITSEVCDDISMWHSVASYQPNLDDDDQSWFWTAEWQAGEAQADSDKEAGRIISLTPEDIKNRIRSIHDTEHS